VFSRRLLGLDCAPAAAQPGFYTPGLSEVLPEIIIKAECALFMGKSSLTKGWHCRREKRISATPTLPATDYLHSRKSFVINFSFAAAGSHLLLCLPGRSGFSWNFPCSISREQSSTSRSSSACACHSLMMANLPRRIGIWNLISLTANLPH